jgi:hypothetical protein
MFFVSFKVQTPPNCSRRNFGHKLAVNWSVISPKLCLLSERSIRYIILSPRTPVFLPIPLSGKFSSDPRTRNRQFVTKISSRAVRRRLYFEGYKKHPVCKKTMISAVSFLPILAPVAS